MKNQKKFLWELMLIFVMLIWSSHYLFSKYLLETYEPMSIVVYRTLFASLALGLIYTLTKKSKKTPHLNRKEQLLMLIVSLVGGVALAVFLVLGIESAGAGLSSIIMNTNPFLVVLFTVFLGMEKLSAKKILGVLIGIFGVILVVLNGKGMLIIEELEHLKGLGFAFLAALSSAFHVIIGKKFLIPKMGSLLFSVFTFVPSALILLAYALGFSPDLLLIESFMDFLIFLYIGVAPTGIAWWIFAMSLKHLDAGHAAIFKLLIPVFTVILAAIFLDEILHFQAYAGMGVIFLGISVVSLQKNKKSP